MMLRISLAVILIIFACHTTIVNSQAEEIPSKYLVKRDGGFYIPMVMMNSLGFDTNKRLLKAILAYRKNKTRRS